MPTLRTRIRGGESAVLEYKISVSSPAKLARNIAAFANSSGGDVIVGVDDKGQVVGVSDRERELELVRGALAYLDPAPETTIESLVHDYRDVIAMHVEPMPYPDLSYVVDGNTRVLYFRIRALTQPVDRDTEKAIVRLRRHFGPLRTLDDDSRRLIAFLAKEGAVREADCADKLNYSVRRFRKLAEELVGAGYLVCTGLGRERSFVLINSKLDRRPR